MKKYGLSLLLIAAMCLGFTATAPVFGENSADTETARAFVGGHVPSGVRFEFPSDYALPQDSELPPEDSDGCESSDEAVAAPPANYDGRTANTATSVQNQGPNGLCWAFAATSLIEANMLKNAQGKQNFSELHMGYSLASRHVGGAYAGGRYGFSDGGNNLISAAYLMRNTFGGTVDESRDPYGAYSASVIEPREVSVTRNKPRSFAVQNIIFLSSNVKSDITPVQVKEAVLKYGAVGTAMWWDGGEPVAGAGSSVFNTETNAYFYNGGAGGPGNTMSTNHEVVIVGWDDNYPKNRFNTTPNRNGAWLAKNCWGAEWGEGGYFWVSYEDTNFPLDAWVIDGVRAFDASKSAVYEHDYMTGSFWDSGLESTSNYYARVFTSARKYEKLEQVVVQIPVSNVRVSVDVITDFRDFYDYTNSSEGLKFNSKGAKSVTRPGYYTIDLNSPVYFEKIGTAFAVVVRVHSSSTRQSRIAYTNTNAKHGTSFLYNPYVGGDYFQSVSASYCIKAVSSSSDECYNCRNRVCTCCPVRGCNRTKPCATRCTVHEECCNCCGECDYCLLGIEPIVGSGRITYSDRPPSIYDALEILKHLVGMDGMVNCTNAVDAALITANSQRKGSPDIFDALEILKYLVRMKNGVVRG